MQMIRPFTLSDFNRILQIEKGSFPKSPYDSAIFLNLYSLFSETFLVYVDELSNQEKGHISGYIIVSPDGHIISIAVHPRHRRKGIGRKLLENAIKKVPSKKIWAEVRKNNQGAQTFYLHLGFQIVGLVPNYYGNEDALILEKEVFQPQN